MLSQKTVLICAILICFAMNAVFLSLAIKHRFTTPDSRGFILTATGPFQKIINFSVQSLMQIWHRYFSLARAAEENVYLKTTLSQVVHQSHQCQELHFSNERLRKLLAFRQQVNIQSVAAEVIGKDPSPWFKSITIDKGKADGIETSMPVVISDGIVGVVTSVADHYARVLLIIDQNSAVDAIVDRTRAHGMIRGQSSTVCAFEYVLRRHEIKREDVVISSGLDGVFPKGLRIGFVSSVMPVSTGIFQLVEVTPYVDYESLEEVIVLLKSEEERDVPE